jgi:hypothetical protein
MKQIEPQWLLGVKREEKCRHMIQCAEVQTFPFASFAIYCTTLLSCYLSGLTITEL